MTKSQFHTTYARVLRHIAKKCLGLQKGEYQVRSNKGGPEVLGEVTLHTDTFYVQIGGLNPDLVLYRSCKGQKDYTGGWNRWLRRADLDADHAGAANLFKAAGEWR
jgi:hypothetical protein